MSYRFINGIDYLEMPREQEPWLVEPLLSPGALMNIYGAPKAGKSRLGLGLALAITNPKQEKWLDRFPIHAHGPVLWLEADNSPYEWWDVLKTVAYGDGYDISNIHFADRDHIPYPFDLLDMEAEHDLILKGMIADFTREWGTPPVLIVIDTIREAHGGDENDSTAMRNVIVRLQAATYPAALCLISHSRKGGGLQSTGGDDDDSGGGRVMEENRGSNYLTGKMQTVVRVTTNRQRTHGYFTAEGRSIGQERFRMKQLAPSYLWHTDVNPGVELARTLKESNPDWSDRRIAREVAQVLKINEEGARNIVRAALKSRSQVDRTGE